MTSTAAGSSDTAPAGDTPGADVRTPAAVLAIDGGNSKTDVALVGADGSLLAAARGGGSNHQGIGIEAATQVLVGLVRQAAETAGLLLDGPIARHTSACLAGVDLPADEADLGELVQSLGWSQTSAVVNDTFAVLRTGLDDDAGEHWGVGVVCGAGINCVGVAPDGTTTRFLSLGSISGDWGGGNDLAREALWWAVRAEDGRGPDTELRRAVPAHFGVERVEDVTIGLHLGKIGYDELHGLVPVLFATAGRGDQAARDLVLRQADEVCRMVTVAVLRLGLTDSRGQVTAGSSRGVPVVLGGSVLAARDPLLTGAITSRLAAELPDAEVRIADVPPVIGAALLGLDQIGAVPGAAARLRASAAATPAS
jgi:N-acetylglucosamine kinase-like BadF-type ATPase